MSYSAEETRKILASEREKFIEGLVGLCSACQVLVYHEDALVVSRGGLSPNGSMIPPRLTQRDSFIASTCLISALRILVKLADSGIAWCRPISDDPTALSTILRFVCSDRSAPRSDTMDVDSVNNEHTDEREANKLDILCLALALLTSIVQQVETARSQVPMASKCYSASAVAYC